MARLWTAGAETRSGTSAVAGLDMLLGGSVAPAYDTGTVRSGAVSWKCQGTVSLSSSVQQTITQAVGTTYYVRAYVNFSVLPDPSAAQTPILGQAGRWTVSHKKADNKLYLQYNLVDIGSPSAAITTGVWYMLELAWRVGTGALDYAEFKLDGTSIASETNSSRVDTAGSNVQAGFLLASNTGVVFVDDIAINDDTGGSQNSWPGDGKVVLLVPTSDNARSAGWVGGAGGTTSLFAAVDNTPPVGVADTGTNTSQIRNATAEANTNYDANMTTYTAAGVGASDTVNVVVPLISTAAPVVTSSKQGTVGVASNPAITNIALGAGGVAGAFWSGVAAGTYPTGWKASFGTTTYAPSVTLGTAPVMRVTQVTSSTRIADVCFMGMYVDYTPAAAPPDAHGPAPRVANQAVHRSSVW
jgi:hypothetical protein